MTIHRIAAWLSRTLAALKQCQRGNVAIIFGLAIIPLVGLVGVAIDYSRANSARTSMQSALDAAALALSKDAQTMTTAQLLAKAKSVFDANFHAGDVKNVVVTPTFTTLASGSFSLKLTGSGTVDTTIAGIWQPTMDIGTSTEVVWGMKRLELVLALDNTGSMAFSSKMTELKKAAKDLLATMQKAAKKADDVKVGIVPFATDVNVGTANVNATWIRWDEWEAANGSCSRSQYTTKSTCQSAGRTWTPHNRNTWDGCAWDRDQPNDTNNVATSSGNKATLYSAHNPPISNNTETCPVSLMTLTNNWAGLNSKVDSMNPVGYTNVTIGLQMAFQMLSPVAPFNASAPKTDLDKVIILLTDGDNTQNRWSGTQSQIDARTKLACTNVKAANIKLYTIRVIDGNASLLRDCATRSDMYYDVQNASQLSAVFSTIAQNLANLRLSQ